MKYFSYRSGVTPLRIDDVRVPFFGANHFSSVSASPVKNSKSFK